LQTYLQPTSKMTRAIVYTSALGFFLIATLMTIFSILQPNWISYSTPSSPDSTILFIRPLGLPSSCTSSPLHLPGAKESDYKTLKDSTLICTSFPTYEDCRDNDRSFCSMWRSVGWLMNVSAVMELVTLIAFIVVLLGGKQKRETGWRILSFLLIVVAVMQCAGMAIVAYLYDNDTDRFFIGWSLDKSFYFCTASWVITILSAAGVSLSAFIFPSEGGYELIPSERGFS